LTKQEVGGLKLLGWASRYYGFRGHTEQERVTGKDRVSCHHVDRKLIERENFIGLYLVSDYTDALFGRMSGNKEVKETKLT